MSEYSFKKSDYNISDFEEQCSYGKKNCWDNFTTSVRPHIYLSLTDILAEDLDHKHYSSLLPGERKRTGNID